MNIIDEIYALFKETIEDNRQVVSENIRKAARLVGVSSSMAHIYIEVGNEIDSLVGSDWDGIFNINNYCTKDDLRKVLSAYPLNSKDFFSKLIKLKKFSALMTDTTKICIAVGAWFGNENGVSRLYEILGNMKFKDREPSVPIGNKDVMLKYDTKSLYWSSIILDDVIDDILQENR